MTYELNLKQFEAVLWLPDVKRFDHFISRIVDYEEIWSLKTKSGWVTVESEGRQCIPFWPHPQYAELFAKGNWIGSTAEVITLDDFIDKWLPGMKKDRVFAAVFPNLEMQGIVCESKRVLVAVNKENEQY
tara:strand:+ start:507 stop:896 length:390 start_codon:yes stop_codon:yes gene_type:complete